MCPDVNLDGSFSSRSGGSRRATLRNRIELIFNRFDYVIYEDLGTHLLEGWAAFFAGALGRSTDFWQVHQQANLESLFNSNFVDIPTHYRPLTSAADGRFIYFFYCDAGSDSRPPRSGD